MGVFSQEGSLVISFFLPFGPTIAVLSSNASSGVRACSTPEPEVTKSANEGPVLSLSLKIVFGFAVAVGWSEDSVANALLVVCEDTATKRPLTCNGGRCRQRNRLAADAIADAEGGIASYARDAVGVELRIANLSRFQGWCSRHSVGFRW
jgi:hypothetical protein